MPFASGPSRHPVQAARARRLVRWLALAALLIAIPPAGPAQAPATAPLTDEVFYQIFVRSFCDSNGDRAGDLRGIQSKLDYLQNLGVTSLLLTPVQPSPFYHSYFASDFEGVDPVYGSVDDFRALVDAVHARGMKLYLDEEFQYATYDHPWLKASIGKPDSKFGRYILFSDAGHTQPEPSFAGLRTFPMYDGRMVPVATVNLRDPDVLAYFERLLVSLVDPRGDGSLHGGVDGFRIDHMMDTLDGKPELTDLFAKFWQPIFARVRARNARARIIAEQADWGGGADWLRRGGVDWVFAFPIRAAVARLDKAAIEQAIRLTESWAPPGKGWLTFIENHDVERFASSVGGDPAKERIGAAFNLLLEGTPLIYYGQELGMRGRQGKWGTDANDIPVREAFRWSRDLEAPGSAIWYRGDEPWWTGRFNRTGDGVSLEEESRDPGSLLAFYRQLLRLRAQRAEIREGSQAILGAAMPNVLGILRRRGPARTLVLVNLAPASSGVAWSDAEAAAVGADQPWVDLLGGRAPVSLPSLTLGPFDVRVLGTP